MHWAEEPPFLLISQSDLNPYNALCVTRSAFTEIHKSNSNWFPWTIHCVTKCQDHENSLAFLVSEASSHSFCTGKDIKELPLWSAICKIITSSAKLNSVFEADATVARLLPPTKLSYGSLSDSSSVSSYSGLNQLKPKEICKILLLLKSTQTPSINQVSIWAPCKIVILYWAKPPLTSHSCKNIGSCGRHYLQAHREVTDYNSEYQTETNIGNVKSTYSLTQSAQLSLWLSIRDNLMPRKNLVTKMIFLVWDEDSKFNHNTNLFRC